MLLQTLKTFTSNLYVQKLTRSFNANSRSYYSLKIFMWLVLIVSLAEFLANDKPLLLYFNDEIYFPIIETISEEELGGDYVNEPDYADPYMQNLISSHGFMIMPPLHFNNNTINKSLPAPAPTPPSLANWLGTDDQGRDILARIIYGLRLSIIFSTLLTISSISIGIFLGAIQGYFGGKLDMFLQRFIEVWSELPFLYIVIILFSIITPSFWWLLLILLLFSWITLVGMVRAEFLKARNLEYVLAAKVLGVSELTIIFKHILPNAMVASFTFLPFIFNSSITTLTALDFLGLGLPPGSPSLGELLFQAKNNLTAYWIGTSIFLSLTILLALLIFIGEAINDAFDPRR